jgi:hypothetical protein
VLSIAITLPQKSASTCEAYCIWNAYFKTELVPVNYDDYDDACFVLDQNAHMEL